MLKFFALAAIFAFSAGQPVHIEFPYKDPCLLIDIDAELRLVWIKSGGQKQTTQNFTLSDAAVLSGNCADQSPTPMVALDLGIGGIFAFRFENISNTVQYTWRLQYTPDTIYKNNQTKPVITHLGTLGTGSPDFAFACSNVPEVNDTQPAIGMDKYQLLIEIKSFKAQAFGVNGGAYSQESRCPADGVITEPTTEPTQPTQPTTKPAEPTTEPTTKPAEPTTEPTTKPSEPTTEPTTKPTTKPTTVTTEPTTKPTEPTTVTTEATTNSTETTETTKPSTATTKPTTPKPSSTTPAPDPNQHPKETFEVYADGVQCVLLEGEFLFSLVYPKKDKTNGTASIGLQKVNSVSGDCNATEDDENIVTVTFYDDWVMDLTISKKQSSVMLGAADSNKYYWSHLTLNYNYNTTLGTKELFPDVDPSAKAAQTLNVTLPAGTYEASTGGSYLCNANQNIDLGGGNTLQTSNLQYDAFATGNHTSFTDKDLTECNNDSKTSSVVPIAVGAALAGLVVIVLIAYLIGRRRNRKGYESV